MNDICEVCFWEDDPDQSADELNDCGANRVCLADTRKHYLAFGACEPDMVKYARKPQPEEMDEFRHGQGFQGLLERYFRM